MPATKILAKQELAPKIVSFVLSAPQIARRAKPGHFVILRLTETGERIPLTIADSDSEAGTVRLVVQIIGKSTQLLGQLNVGDDVLDLLGPLGTPVEIKKLGRVVCVAGGLGAAPVYPKAKALKEAGNYVVTILGAQTKEMIVMAGELAAVSDEMLYATNDGSFGHKGFVTDPLRDYLEKHEVNEVIAVGPVPMMKAVCDVTKQFGVSTMVSLNAVMVDGTGMCGGCRVTVDGEVKFTCVEGPAFDGHMVDFNELVMRQRFYKKEEQASMADHVCRIGGVG